jgi:curved DNA-binding protein CbpA
VSDSPFAVLGLPARADLSDDEVRAAWRRLAAATHPDRADGGDPARFAAAAAAYTVLRTRSGRGEALADLTAPAPPLRLARASRPAPPAAVPTSAGRTPQPQPGRRDDAVPADAAATPGAARVAAGQPGRWAGRVTARIRSGRPARLLLRVVIAAAVSAAVIAMAGAQPATPALIVGALTWLLLTAPRDLAPPR